MPDMPPECSVIAELLPDYVRLACMRVQEAAPDVLEAERPFVKKAVEKRRREFSAGRTCARQALRELGCADAPIVHNQNGAPLWPPGIVGSITHSNTYAAAVAAKSLRACGLGIDMETVSRLSPAIAGKILTGPEQACLQHQPNPSAQQRLLALYFSAKEAIYKCLHPLLQSRIGFEDACIECISGQDSIKISLCPRIQSVVPGVERLHGRYCYFDDTVCALVWLEPEA